MELKKDKTELELIQKKCCRNESESNRNGNQVKMKT